MIEKVIEYIDAILTIALKTTVILSLLLNAKGILSAFKGSDGKWSIREFALFTIVGILIYMTYKDATRDHEYPHFTPLIYGIFVSGLFAMADLSHVIKEAKGLFKKNDDKKPVNYSGNPDP